MKNTFEKKYDVIVAGAGIAGISAALAAARHGCSVCLLDKQVLIGGLATSGFIFVYLPLCDGQNHQVTFGIAEELLLASMNYGPYQLSKRWGGQGCAIDDSVLSEGAEKTAPSKPRDRYAVQFSPAGMILMLDKLLKQAGVDLWLDTRLCDVRMNGDDVTAVEVENDSGFGILHAKRFVDASGDSHVVRHAGGRFVRGKNFNNLWHISYDPILNGGYSLGKPVMMVSVPGRREEREALLSGREFSEFVRESWQIARNYYDRHYQEEHLDRFSAYPLALPSMPQFRTTARIEGMTTIRADEYNQSKEDSVGLIGDWRHAGRIWETSYGALIPEKTGNTFAAGRCIASDGDAWEAYRVIPACAMTGEVTGTAAALSIQKNVEPKDLSLDILRAELRKNGFKFHIDEVLK